MEKVNNQNVATGSEKLLTNMFSVLTRRKGKKTYPKNRVGMRASMHDTGTLKGHTRKSAASAKIHTPTDAELAAWADWKYEQKNNKAASNG